MKRATWCLGLLMGLTAACKSRDNTGIVVEVWSDLAIPNQLSGVRIDVSDDKGSSSETFLLTSRSQLPVHLALVPGGAKDAALTIKAVGLLGGADIVWQAAHVAFVPGEGKLLQLVLESRCAGAGCSAVQSCAAGVCVVVPTINSLRDYDPKATPVEPDAGTRSSIDAGDDVAARDASQAETGKDATADRFPEDAKADALIGTGGTGGNTTGTGGAGETGGSTGGMGGNTTGSAGGIAGGVAGSSGAGMVAGGSGGAGGQSAAGGTGGTSPMGGSTSSGTVALPPDAGPPADAPIGGSAGGASGGASATTGSGGTGGTGGTTSAVVDCGPLSKPSNGTVDVTATTYNSTATYSCTTTGYTLSGDAGRTCQANGTWSGSAPTCVLVDCGPLSKPSNGAVDVPTTTYNSTATYLCTTTGYTLSGAATRTCQANGTWSGSAPSCALVDCGPLDKPNNGAVAVTTTTYNSTASYSCTTTGYVLLGDDVRTCQASGSWTGSAPTCILAYGGTCSTTSNCPADSVCCNGSVQKCDTTRLPAGNGTNTGQYAISTDNEMITDTITGLVWQRGVSAGRPGCALSPNCTWVEASAYCDGLVLSGFTDWRLPSMAELRTIVDFTRVSPAIDLGMFPDTASSWFWTSSPYAGPAGQAWAITFADGLLGNTAVTGTFRVRCVR
jgi:hypothetical protein